MSTVREDIALVRKGVNSVHNDTRLTNQFIYHKLLDTAKLIIRRDAETRRIFSSVEIFKELECVKLQPDSLKNCTNIIIPGCTSVMRSINKIPKSYLSSNGSILMVYSIDRSVQFFQTTPSKFVNIKKREYKGNQNYFWITDDYLYIPDSSIEVVSILGLFIDNSKLGEDQCLGILDSNSSIPDYLKFDVVRTVVQEIAGVTRRLPEDESVELNSNKLN